MFLANNSGRRFKKFGGVLWVDIAVKKGGPRELRKEKGRTKYTVPPNATI